MNEQLFSNYIDPLHRLALYALELTERTTIVQLLFIAIVAGASAGRLVRDDKSRPASVAGGIVLTLNFFHHFEFGHEFTSLVMLLVRSILFYHITVSVVSVIATVLSIIGARIRSGRQRITKFVGRVRDAFAERRAARRRRWIAKHTVVPPPKPAPSLDERLQSFAKQARAEYDAEVRMLRALPLDRDEYEILEIQAKRRLLQKLRARS